jgi:hypothetical protein
MLTPPPPTPNLNLSSSLLLPTSYWLFSQSLSINFWQWVLPPPPLSSTAFQQTRTNPQHSSVLYGPIEFGLRPTEFHSATTAFQFSIKSIRSCNLRAAFAVCSWGNQVDSGPTVFCSFEPIISSGGWTNWDVDPIAFIILLWTKAFSPSIHKAPPSWINMTH